MTGIINPGSGTDGLAVSDLLSCASLVKWDYLEPFLSQAPTYLTSLDHSRIKEKQYSCEPGSQAWQKRGGRNQVIASLGSANLHTIPSLLGERKRGKISNSKSPVPGRYGKWDSEKKNLFECILLATNQNKYTSISLELLGSECNVFCELWMVSGNWGPYPLLLI